MKLSPQFLLEVLNGTWGVAAFSLGVVCWMYLFHEMISLAAWRPWRWSQGMRVAINVSLVAAGVWITRSVIYYWRHIGAAEHFSSGQLYALIVGGAVGTVGFVLLIREISRPLFGNAPWILSLIALVAMTAYTVLYHLPVLG